MAIYNHFVRKKTCQEIDYDLIIAQLEFPSTIRDSIEYIAAVSVIER